MASKVDDYLRTVPKEIQPAIERLRQTIRAVLPDADEVISYGIPMFKQDGHGVVAYNATKAGVTLQVMSGTLLDDHQEALRKYKRAKGSVQFPTGQPLPVPLIKKLVKERLVENKARYAKKVKK
jgi:uncharacterized protein YdhG (YjbR/CyaY superfamily)